ncbi:MAG: GNAT family N-acetyltransferase [Deltaproteobacteria bacterium HGW-Deltaproteobacteria-14]|jgi:predicted GNAT family N-acyltransferase|nr:MAG: GNAT family N-acetyltransferase [Deltaproteobacteria bacterium HGW-Deltaproteobacteria-14]
MRVAVEPDPTTLEAAFQLRQRVFVEEQGVPAALERDALDAVAHHVVLLEGERAIGTGRVRLVAPDVAKVERVAVDVDRRGQGSGRRVMEALEERARALGAANVRLAAQESAVAFYQRLGYTAHGERFWDAGLPHRWMDKALR